MHRKLIFGLSILMTNAMMFASESPQVGMYIQKHVSDSDCNEIIKFVHLDNDGEIALGGLHVAEVSHAGVEWTKDLNSINVINAIARGIQHYGRGRMSELDIQTFDRNQQLKKIIDDENASMDSVSNSRPYPKYATMSWQQFAKIMPHLAQELEKSDVRLQGILKTIADPRVRFLEGRNELCMDYLESGSIKKFDPAQTKMPLLTKQNDASARMFIHHEAWNLFKDKLSTTNEQSFNRCKIEHAANIAHWKKAQIKWQSEFDKAQAELDVTEETRPSRRLEQLITARRDARRKVDGCKKREKQVDREFQQTSNRYQECLKELENPAAQH